MIPLPENDVFVAGDGRTERRHGCEAVQNIQQLFGVCLDEEKKIILSLMTTALWMATNHKGSPDLWNKNRQTFKGFNSELSNLYL